MKISNVILYDRPGAAVDITFGCGIIHSISIHHPEETADADIDAGGMTAIPGCIDLHIQGAGGADVLDGTPEALQTISAALAKTGTTGFLATTVMKPSGKNFHLQNLRELPKNFCGGASMLGIHLEGPFVSLVRKGGLSPDGIYSSSAGALDEIFNLCGNLLRMMTIAPELPGNLDIIRLLNRNNVIASFGHSDADYRQTLEGIETGITHATHLFNAMRPLHHRDPGPLGAILEHDSVTAQVISDGVHIDPSLVRLLWKQLGHRRFVCITDGISGTGLPDGKYLYNGKEYFSADGAARYSDGTLIGTTLGLWNIAKRMMKYTGASLADAVETASVLPAQILGLGNRKGKIMAGYDADIVLLDRNLDPLVTIAGGNIAAGIL